MTAASTGDIITAYHNRVSVFDQAGEYVRDFVRPDWIREWSQCRVNAYRDGERAVVVVTNRCSRDYGGGAYVFSEDGRYTGERVLVDEPEDAAALDDHRIAVVRYDDGMCGWLEVYDVKTNKLISSVLCPVSCVLCEANQLRYISYISVSPVTCKIIVSHDGGVTAYSSANLAPRWEYRRRKDGAGQLRLPWGVCVDQAGRVLVSDAVTRRVVVLSEVGEYVTALSTDGFIMFGPHGLTLTPHSQLVMSGNDNNCHNSLFITEYLER